MSFDRISLEDHHALRDGAGIGAVSARAQIAVAGKDRAAYLQGLLTNDIQALTAGTGCYAAWLTPQGRMITDVIVIETGSETLLDVPAALAAAIAEKLDRLIFAEDARVADASGELGSLAHVGPAARSVLIVALAESGRRGALEDPSVVAVDRKHHVVWTHAFAGPAGVNVYGPHDVVDQLERDLKRGGVAVPLDAATASVLRVEAGIPQFLIDMGEETIPLEAGLDSIISYTKGCYVGQEIIVRIRDRAHGRVARKLVGLSFQDGAVPHVPQGVTRDGRHAGRVTSGVMSPGVGHSIGLATLLRDFTEPGTPVVLEDGTPAVVAALPFVG